MGRQQKGQFGCLQNRLPPSDSTCHLEMFLVKIKITHITHCPRRVYSWLAVGPGLLGAACLPPPQNIVHAPPGSWSPCGNEAEVSPGAVCIRGWVSYRGFQDPSQAVRLGCCEPLPLSHLAGLTSAMTLEHTLPSSYCDCCPGQGSGVGGP